MGHSIKMQSKLENLTLFRLSLIAIKNGQQANRCNCRCMRGWVGYFHIYMYVYIYMYIAFGEDNSYQIDPITVK